MAGVFITSINSDRQKSFILHSLALHCNFQGCNCNAKQGPTVFHVQFTKQAAYNKGPKRRIKYEGKLNPTKN